MKINGFNNYDVDLHLQFPIWEHLGFCEELSYQLCPGLLKKNCVLISFVPRRCPVQLVAHGELVISKIQTASAQHCSFAVVGPASWNALHAGLWWGLLSLSPFIFRKCLKTTFFPTTSGTQGKECIWRVLFEVALYKFPIIITVRCITSPLNASLFSCWMAH